jgi:hypothetical protein
MILSVDAAIYCCQLLPSSAKGYQFTKQWERGARKIIPLSGAEFLQSEVQNLELGVQRAACSIATCAQFGMLQ